MAVYRSGSSVDAGTRTNTTIVAPSGIQNDIDRLRIHFYGEVTATPPPGFTELVHVTFVAGGGTATVHLYIWDKLARAESGDYTVTHASSFTSAFMECVTGIDATLGDDGEDFTATTNTVTGANGGTYTATGGTTGRGNSLITFSFACWDDASPVTEPTGTTPTFTERYDPANCVLYVANGPLATAGATGNKSATGNAQTANGGYSAALTSVKASQAGIRVGVAPNQRLPEWFKAQRREAS